jgi:hypothetical protein
MNKFMQILNEDNTYEDEFLVPTRASKREFYPHVKSIIEFIKGDQMLKFGIDFYNILGNIQSKGVESKCGQYKVGKTLMSKRHSWDSKHKTIESSKIFDNLNERQLEAIVNPEQRAIVAAFLRFKQQALSNGPTLFNQTPTKNIDVNIPVKLYKVSKIQIDSEARSVVSDIKDGIIVKMAYRPKTMSCDFYGYRNDDPSQLLAFNGFTYSTTTTLNLSLAKPNTYSVHSSIRCEGLKINSYEVALQSDEYLQDIKNYNKLAETYLKSYNYFKSHFVDRLLINGIF